MTYGDFIEASEAPLDVILPLDDVTELQEYFGIFTDL